MHPHVLSRVHPQPQLFESLLLGSEIRQWYRESDVINKQRTDPALLQQG
jgi:hypothetical protein